MKARIYLVWILSFCLLFSSFHKAVYANEGMQQYEAIKELDASLYSTAAVLMDADTGRVLYEKNGDKLLPMASTTKIMTCIVALENANLDDVYTVSDYAASMPKVHMCVSAGEEFYLKDLLIAMMLESYNDAAVIIAEGVAGSVEAFAALMNAKAKEIGAVHTNFVTPNGLDADGHQTTASDLALIMAYCINNETFLEITQSSSHTFSNIEGTRTYSASNLNTFLTAYEGAISGKTGFTGKAGYCYVGAAERDGKRFTIALLACGWPSNRTWKWADARKLFDYGFEYYEKILIKLPDIVLPDISVNRGKSSTVSLTVDDSSLIPVLYSSLDFVKIAYETDQNIGAPISTGTQVGEFYAYIGDYLMFTLPIVCVENVDKIDYLYILFKVVKYAVL